MVNLRIKPNSLMTLVFILLFTPLLVNAVIQQFTIALNGVANSFYLPVLLAIIFLALITIFANKKLGVRLGLFISCFIYFIYTLSMFPYYSKLNGVEYTISSFYSSTAFYILLLISVVPTVLSGRLVFIALMLLITITSVLGVYQYTFTDAVVSVADQAGNFKISSYMFVEVFPYRMRGFSLFNSALDFGYFLIFCIGILIARFNARNALHYAMLTLMLAAVYATLTRNIYFGSLIAICAVIIFRRYNIHNRFLYLLPVISFVLGIGISLFQGASSGLSSSSSLQIRRTVWNAAIDRLAQGDVIESLIGSGIYQSGDIGTGKLFVDNTYLHFIAQFGFIGFIIFISIYLFLLDISIKHRFSPFMAGLYGFLVAYPFLALFNICISPIALYSAIAIVSDSKFQDRKCCNE